MCAPRKTMPLAELSQMADLAARLGMERIFYLNLGEPFLSPTICQELPLLRAKNPDAYIRVSTNGVLLNTDAKREAALELERHPVFRPRHQRRDVREIHDARKF